MTAAKTFALETLRILLPLGILAVGVGSFLAVNSREAGPPQPGPAEAQPVQKTAPPLSKAEPVPLSTPARAVQQEQPPLTATGVVVPRRAVKLAAEVAGRIVMKAQCCQVGHTVKKGALLAKLDAHAYDLEVARLEQELKKANVALTEIENEIDNATGLIPLAREQVQLHQARLMRARQLMLRSATSAADLDEARGVEISARSTLLTLEHQLRLHKNRRQRQESAIKLATIQLEQARLNLQHTEIRAPLDGVIVACPLEVDGFVQPGTELLTIADAAHLEVRCEFRPEDLAQLPQSTDSFISSEEPDQGSYAPPAVAVEMVYQRGEQKYVCQGRLTRYETIRVDAQTHTIPCRIRLTESAQLPPLACGQCVQVRIIDATAETPQVTWDR